MDEKDERRLASITVRSSGHHETLVNGLWNFFTSRHGVDMKFQFGDRTFPAHQLIWDVFLPAGVVGLSRCQAESIMDFLLEFLYKGEVVVPEERLNDLLNVGKQLKFQMLIDAIESTKTCCEIIRQTICKQSRREAILTETSKSEFSYSVCQRETRSSKKAAQAGTAARLSILLEKNKKMTYKGVRSSQILSDAAFRNMFDSRLTRAKTRASMPTETNRANPGPSGQVEDQLTPIQSLVDETEIQVNSSSSENSKQQQTSSPLKCSGSPKDLDKPVQRKRNPICESILKLSRRKQWRLPTNTINVRASKPAATTESHSNVGIEAIVTATRPTVEVSKKTFKCGHCDFSSTIQELVADHIRTLHLPTMVADDKGDAILTKPGTAGIISQDIKGDLAVSSLSTLAVKSGGLHFHSVVPEATSTDTVQSLPTLVCPECSFSTSSANLYQVHLAIHDPSVDYFKCTSCERSYPCAETFRSHETEHHPDAPTTIKCPRCTARRLQLSSYLSHLMLAHQVDCKGQHLGALICQCPQCAFTCSKADDMVLHAKSHRRSWTIHKCGRPECEVVCSQSLDHRTTEKEKAVHRRDQCDYGSPCQKEAVQQVERVHVRQRGHVCDTCGYRTQSINRMRDHYRTHTGERPYMCEVCARSFTEESTLKRHLKERHGDSNVKCHFTCSNCDRSFRRKHTLVLHSKLCGLLLMPRDGSKVARPTSCRHCLTVFPSQKAMVKHALVDHPGQHPLACESCNFTCNDPSSLRKHSTIHTGVKPYRCSTCNRAFRDYGTCKRHERCVHLGEPSDCPICNKTFASSVYMKNHVKVIHRCGSASLKTKTLDGKADVTSLIVPTMSESAVNLSLNQMDAGPEVDETEAADMRVQMQVNPSEIEERMELAPAEIIFLEVIEIPFSGIEIQCSNE